MVQLREIVELDTKGEFRSDVQLSDYDKSSLNLSCCSPIFFYQCSQHLWGEHPGCGRAGFAGSFDTGLPV